MSQQETHTTTVTTTTSSSSSEGCTFHTSYLLPQGLLKIIEIILCIVLLALASGLGGRSWLGFIIAISLIFAILTFIMLIIYLFNLPNRLCGRKACGIVELGVCVFAIICFFISFILCAVYCSYKHLITRETLIIEELLASAIISIVLMILYIVSLVLGFKSGTTPMITVRS